MGACMVVMISEGTQLAWLVDDYDYGAALLRWGGGEESRLIVCGFSCTLCWG